MTLPVICLMGPTAAGKTALALELAEKFTLDIVSVDSALIYRGMNIGTAKPTPAILKQFPHHLIDICEPTESYSAGQFLDDVKKVIASLHQKNKVPLLVGGTMLYYRALQQGLARLPVANKVLRDELDSLRIQYGTSYLHQKLTQVDPISAQRIHHHDSQRLQRALEVFMASGKPLSDFLIEHQPITPYRFINIVISPFQRHILHSRIASRFSEMMTDGFLEEVRSLFSREELSRELPAMRCVGYRQLLGYCANEYSLDEAINKGIIATRQMAKRQITWLRSQPDAVWFNSENGLPINEVTSYLCDKAPELID